MQKKDNIPSLDTAFLDGATDVSFSDGLTNTSNVIPSFVPYTGVYNWYSVHYFPTCKRDSDRPTVYTRRPFGYTFSLLATVLEDFAPRPQDLSTQLPFNGAINSTVNASSVASRDLAASNLSLNTLPSTVLLLLGILFTFAALLPCLLPPRQARLHAHTPSPRFRLLRPQLSSIFLLSGAAVTTTARSSANGAFENGQSDISQSVSPALSYLSALLMLFAAVLPYLAAWNAGSSAKEYPASAGAEAKMRELKSAEAANGSYAPVKQGEGASMEESEGGGSLFRFRARQTQVEHPFLFLSSLSTRRVFSDPASRVASDGFTPSYEVGPPLRFRFEGIKSSERGVKERERSESGRRDD
ncbi:hypothetical protein MMC13_004335 [Lambiella insularis]|nr:hypothetical protein [Lambiella insularis]